MNKQIIKPLITGGILILIGFLFLVDELSWFHVGHVFSLWPFILVVIGISKMIGTRSTHDFISGSWLIFLGLWLYVSIQNVLGLSFAVTWPFILIFWGLTMIAKELLPVTFGKQESENVYE